ncbi:MAG: hypothetical protein IT373_08390, partial [Polyangiaceae bacterium]|nr:hypothetical protein [Polyangiaceae bacterium]
CGSANGACQGTTMTCGGNTCTGTCAGGNALPTLECDPGSACACTPC